MDILVKLAEETEDTMENLDSFILEDDFIIACDEIELITSEQLTDITALANTTEVNINSTLAEVSFMEANELIAKGDYLTAIKFYQDAVIYEPNNQIYRQKLAQALELAKNKQATTNTAKKMTGKELQNLTNLSNSSKTSEKASSSNNKKEEKAPESVNETLAAVSFMEASELLDTGNIMSAIDRLREAVKYDPNNSVYATKLASVLAESKIAKTSSLKKSDLPKAALALLPEDEEKPASISKGKTTKLSKKLKTVEDSPDSPLSTTISSKKTRTSRRSFIATVISLVVISLVAIFYQSQTVVLTPVKLSYPTDQAKLNTNQLEFEWQSMGNKFLFQIESLGKVIVSVYTEETRYKLTDQEIKLFKLKTDYKWRVVPVDFKGQELPSKVQERWFEVIQ
jgi:tetratricopeptide (TPR) repeat protein